MAQWRVPPRRSDTHDAVVWLEATSPPAWTQGAVSPPWMNDHRGVGEPPWCAERPHQVGGPGGPAGQGSVRRRRRAAEATQVRTGLEWALANDGMVSPLEMLRPGPRTRLAGPVPAGGLQHVGPRGVGHQKAVVIGELGTLVAARSPLSVALEQVDDGGDGALRGRRPLEGQPHQVHPHQGLLAGGSE